jgi:hypothetical protein
MNIQDPKQRAIFRELLDKYGEGLSIAVEPGATKSRMFYFMHEREVSESRVFFELGIAAIDRRDPLAREIKGSSVLEADVEAGEEFSIPAEILVKDSLWERYLRARENGLSHKSSECICIYTIAGLTRVLAVELAASKIVV